MKQDKRDRRSQRTRQLVNSAMHELLGEKRFEAITVQHILDRAGIGRSTFYSHYYDKEDVHMSMMKEMIDGMNLQLAEKHPTGAILPSLELFQHVYSDRRQFQAVVSGQTGERLWEMMRRELSRIIERSLAYGRDEGKALSIPLTVVSAYLGGAFLNLLKWWVKEGMPYEPGEMDRIFRQLALPGVWAALGRAEKEAPLDRRQRGPI